mgnify:CR=1 FL=1
MDSFSYLCFFILILASYTTPADGEYICILIITTILLNTIWITGSFLKYI